MTKTKKLMIPAVIIIITVIITQIIMKNPPKSNRGKGPVSAPMTVETLTLKLEAYQVMLTSFGTVKPRTQSKLVAQASGQINEVSPQFRDGAFFEKGDVLLSLDDRDHQAEVKINQSSLMSAKQGLLEEQARAERALVDWQRLGDGKTPSALVLRKPQLAAAQAKVLSAQARLEKAQLVLERSKIIAPYAGRILKKHVDLGQVVNNNTQLADIYAVDYVEIRLPINNRDLDLLVLPEEYRQSNKVSVEADALSGTFPDTLSAPYHDTKVTLNSTLIGKQSWQGRIVRTEGAIDANSHQLYIIAQIDDPYEVNNTRTSPVKIGQYVTADITGKVIENALMIPNSAIYQGSYVYIVEDSPKGSVLKRQEVTIRWQNQQDALISKGLAFGQQLVLTPLGQVSSGTPVKIANDVTRQNSGISSVSSSANSSTNTRANIRPNTRPNTGNNKSRGRQARIEKRAQELGITVSELKARGKKAHGKKDRLAEGK